MGFLRAGCLWLVVVATLAGCSTGTGTDGNDDGNGDGGDDGDDPVMYSLDVDTYPSDGGSVEPSSKSYEEGTTIEVTADPADEWLFSGWRGDTTTEANPISISMDEDKRLTARFGDLKSQFDVDIEIRGDRGRNTVVEFGRYNGLSKGFDEEWDESSPPPPPGESVHAYFESEGRDLFIDYRGIVSPESEWTLQYMLYRSYQAHLEWFVSENSANKGSLTLTDPQGNFEVDMFNQSSYTVDHGSRTGTLIIEYDSGSE